MASRSRGNRVPSGNGIEISVNSHRTTLRNGSIKGFGSGVRSIFSNGYPRSCTIRDLAVSQCNSAGIIAGEGALVESCRLHDISGGNGIIASFGSTVTRCTLTNSATGFGITVGTGSTISHCSVSRMTAGSVGIFANGSSSMSDCVAYNNDVIWAIRAETGSTLARCSAQSNESAQDVSGGIMTAGGCRIVDCISSQNSSTAGTSTPTTGIGFDIGNASSIENCGAGANKGDGIKVNARTIVRGNSSQGNGEAVDAAGIHVTGSDNRIEGNNLVSNGRGIAVDAPGNFIVRNSATGSIPNYDIIAGNSVGQITNVAPAGPSPQPTVVVTSANGWANFTY